LTKVATFDKVRVGEHASNMFSLTRSFEESRMLVYLVTNKINGKKYVGQHVGDDLQRYWRRKTCEAKRRKHQALFSAILKYGKENFKIEPLVIVGTKQDMDFYERQFILKLRTKAPEGYNLTDGGGGSLGRSPSFELRKRISKALIGRSKPNKLKGIPRSLEVKEKISKTHMGKVLSDFHIQQLKLGSHNRWHVKKGIVNPECKLCQGQS
jgi:group I intron endonuclease